LTRANRFHFERDRLRFVRCRTALGFLLGGQLGMPADEIRFEYHASGKREVAVEQNPRRLRLNVSDSADLALISVTADRRLDADIENTRADVDIATLSKRFFSAREYAGLQVLPPHLRLQAFFACWTRMGAFIKATDDGPSFPLSDFTVSTHPRSILSSRRSGAPSRPPNTGSWQISAQKGATARP
jgi:4'-phosphopantetheinyl transferase